MKNIESQLCLGTGPILALYVVQHLIKHAFGIVSIEVAEAYRQTVGAVSKLTGTDPAIRILPVSRDR